MTDRTEPTARGRSRLAADALKLPNLLTFGRILAIPAVLLALGDGGRTGSRLAALLFALASLTDFLDGWLARRLGLVSVLGKLLDPLADKLLVLGAMVWLVAIGRLEAWIVVLTLARELCVTSLRAVASSEGIVIAAGGDGKVKAALQMIGVLLLLLAEPLAGGVWLPSTSVVGRWFVLVSLWFSLTSAFSYARGFAAAVDARP